MKKLTRIAALIAALILIPVVPSFADGFVPKPIDERGGDIALYLQDNNEEQEVISTIEQLSSPGHRSFYCDSLTAAECGGETSPSKKVNAILPVCGTVAENCIEGVAIYKAGETPTAAKYVKNFDGMHVDSIPGINNQRGVSPSLWSAPSVINAGGSTEYVVAPRLSYFYQNGEIRLSSFAISVNAVVGTQGSRYKQTAVANYPDAKPPTSDPLVQWDTCAASDTNYCAVRVDFAENTRVAVTLKLSAGVTGWLHGRIKDPQISSQAIGIGFNRVTIDAQVVDIPKMYTVMKSAELPKWLLDKIIFPNVSDGTISSWAQPQRWRPVRASGSDALSAIPVVRESAKDTAASVGTSWRLESLNALGNDNGISCLASVKQVGGIVATNAMAYDGGIPTWDGKQLVYHVAGMHYLPDGKTPAEGTYDLSIQSEVARCLYGFNKAPIQASVQVVGENGETKVATTVVSEKDGWLKLAAYGFTFSSPTISVKLSQAKTPAKKTTITCVKGKLTKKVTAVNASCPAGYKKK